jgi:hypothetical protein
MWPENESRFRSRSSVGFSKFSLTNEAEYDQEIEFQNIGS